MRSCAACGAEVAAGSRWCGICRSYALDPKVGRLASPGKRLGAFVLDVVLPWVVVALILMAGGVASEGGGGELGVAVMGLLFIGFVVLELVLFARGTSLGKKLLGMRVVKEDGRPAGFGTMLLREWVGRFISGLFFGLGYLWILLDRERQAWHDKLASTYVVER